MELTEVFTSGQDWWTLGFEATGPEDALHSALQATAALVFAQAMPGSVEPGPDESRSYMEWLCQRPGAERYADASRLSLRRTTPEGWCPQAEDVRLSAQVARAEQSAASRDLRRPSCSVEDAR